MWRIWSSRTLRSYRGHQKIHCHIAVCQPSITLFTQPVRKVWAQIDELPTLKYAFCRAVAMTDRRQWNIALSQLDALRRNIPPWIDENRVREYHSILDLLHEASDEDFTLFRIPQTELRPKVTSVSRAAYHRPGRVIHSEKHYCDDDFFVRKVEAASQFVADLEAAEKPLSIGGPIDYWSMPDHQLEQLVKKHNILPWARASVSIYSNRSAVVEALVQRDAHLRGQISIPQHSNVTHVHNMHNSVIQQGTQSSRANINSGKPSMLAKCFKSIRSIFENAAGGVIAALLLKK
jgi:hypothetical protein